MIAESFVQEDLETIASYRAGFVGVLVDRLNRKLLIVFVGGVILGAGGAFFGPATASILLDIVGDYGVEELVDDDPESGTPKTDPIEV
jgi:hypothetical protein